MKTHPLSDQAKCFATRSKWPGTAAVIGWAIAMLTISLASPHGPVRSQTADADGVVTVMGDFAGAFAGDGPIAYNDLADESPAVLAGTSLAKRLHDRSVNHPRRDEYRRSNDDSINRLLAR